MHTHSGITIPPLSLGQLLLKLLDRHAHIIVQVYIRIWRLWVAEISKAMATLEPVFVIAQLQCLV